MEFNGKNLGPYQIEAELGRGGTATIYRAVDTRNGQTIALKILSPLMTNDEMFLKRFIKEGKNATLLRHANIVATYEAGVIDGAYYLAMELVTGGTLTELSNQRDQLLSIDENIDILSQIAAALDFAHSQGFVHRDVKPSNILITEDGRALLTDFGTAKQMVGEHTLMTGAGQRIGTPSFMSPEQISGEIKVDYRTDVYSLGVIAYKLFTGRLPFAADNQAELLHKIVYETPLAPDVLNPDLPPNIVQHLNRALAKDPAQRYESAGQFIATLFAGQMWAAKQAAKQLSSMSPKSTSNPIIQRTRGILPLFKVALRPLVVALVVLTLFLSPVANLRHLSGAQIQTRVIAEADYLSGILLTYFDSPQTKIFWDRYAAPLVSHFSLADQPKVDMNTRLQTVWQNLVSFKDPNSWLQRTWRDWNRKKVSDLLGVY